MYQNLLNIFKRNSYHTIFQYEATSLFNKKTEFREADEWLNDTDSHSYCAIWEYRMGKMKPCKRFGIQLQNHSWL